MNKTQLDDFRKSIDLIDSAIISLLTERIRLVKKVGRYKKKQNIPALQPERWQEVLSNKKQLASKSGLSTTFVENIYNTIHNYALKIENDA
jgi:chorismate mutase